MFGTLGALRIGEGGLGLAVFSRFLINSGLGWDFFGVSSELVVGLVLLLGLGLAGLLGLLGLLDGRHPIASAINK
jgi:hypothetical protein